MAMHKIVRISSNFLNTIESIFRYVLLVAQMICTFYVNILFPHNNSST